MRMRHEYFRIHVPPVTGKVFLSNVPYQRQNALRMTRLTGVLRSFQ